jgi:hypothetical protein
MILESVKMVEIKGPKEKLEKNEIFEAILYDFNKLEGLFLMKIRFLNFRLKKFEHGSYFGLCIERSSIW